MAPRDLSRPEIPDRSYADALNARTERLAALAEHVASPFAGASASDAAEVGAAVDELAPEIIALSHRVFETPEEAFQEVRSAEAVAETAERRPAPCSSSTSDRTPPIS